MKPQVILKQFCDLLFLAGIYCYKHNKLWLYLMILNHTHIKKLCADISNKKYSPKTGHNIIHVKAYDN